MAEQPKPGSIVHVEIHVAQAGEQAHIFERANFD